MLPNDLYALLACGAQPKFAMAIATKNSVESHCAKAQHFQGSSACIMRAHPVSFVLL